MNDNKRWYLNMWDMANSSSNQIGRRRLRQQFITTPVCVCGCFWVPICVSQHTCKTHISLKGSPDKDHHFHHTYSIQFYQPNNLVLHLSGLGLVPDLNHPLGWVLSSITKGERLHRTLPLQFITSTPIYFFQNKMSWFHPLCFEKVYPHAPSCPLRPTHRTNQCKLG